MASSTVAFCLVAYRGKCNFLRANSPSFLMQIVVVGVLIYFTAPALLLKKKYVLFTIVSVFLIILCSFIISNNFIGPPNILPPHPDNVPPLGNRQRMVPRGGPQGHTQFYSFSSIKYFVCSGDFHGNFFICQKKEEEVIVNKNEALQTELKLLKSQINPHFYLMHSTTFMRYRQ